jgi:hypothetical protein
MVEPEVRRVVAVLQEWAKPIGERLSYLNEMKVPVLIVGGTSDIIFYTINSGSTYISSKSDTNKASSLTCSFHAT